jgi:hypothetical protein
VDENIQRVLASMGRGMAATMITAVQQEYPNAPQHVMRDDDDLPIPREVHPAFYGCYDWHSAVEMHWALAALVRAVPDGEFVTEARAVLDRHLSAANLQREADYLAAHPSFERPYGWGWVLDLADELAGWAEEGDGRAAAWSRNLTPLAGVVEAGFVAWLPKPAYPDRCGTHSNSAFALARALPWGFRRARAGHPALRDAIGDAAERWFAADQQYPAQFEPSGADFLSPTLTEIMLMKVLVTPESFDEWYEGFLEEGLPDNLMYPARVTDPTDGQGAHLYGLNLYRAHALLRLSDLAIDELERRVMDLAVMRHVDAAADGLRDQGWMTQHWLAAYAVLALR